MATFNFPRPSFPPFSSPSSNTSLMPKCAKLKLKTCHSQLASNVSISSSPRKPKLLDNEKVQQVESIEEFDELLALSLNELVLVAFAPNHDFYTTKILHFMRELSETCKNNTRLLYVVGDGLGNSKELCQRENIIGKVPIFHFYKGMQKIHQIEGLEFDQLKCDVLYYSKNHDNIVHLHSRDDFDKLISDGKSNERLIVILIGLKCCGPCSRVYPTVLQLSRQMDSTVVFARMDGDESEGCEEFLRDMDVVEVPTFLFARDGQICGRYIGSNKSKLIKELAKYKGNLGHIY